MLVVLAVVVVDVRGADALLHDVEFPLPRPRPCCAWPVSNTKFRSRCVTSEEVQQALGGRKIVRNIFQQNLDAALPRENAQFLERRERRVHLALVELLARSRPGAGSGSGTESISAISSARLISSTICSRLRLHRLRDVDDGVRPGPAPDLVGVHRRVQRVQLQLGIAKPVAQFRRSAPCCGNPDAAARKRSRPPESPPASRGSASATDQPMIDEQMRRENVIHAINILSPCLPCADRPRLPAIRPSPRIAATSPCPSSNSICVPARFEQRHRVRRKPRSIRSSSGIH